MKLVEICYYDKRFQISPCGRRNWAWGESVVFPDAMKTPFSDKIEVAKFSLYKFDDKNCAKRKQQCCCM